jgi:hypothetical protein
MAAQVPPRERERVVQVGALLVDALQAGQFGGGHRPRMTAKGDDLQRIRAEPGTHQMTQRQRRSLKMCGHRSLSATCDAG